MKYKNPERFKAAFSRAAACAVALSVFAGNAFAQEADVDVELERSTNLHDWESVPLDRSMLSPDGKIRPPSDGDSRAFFRLRVEEATPVVDGIMIFVQGGTLPPESELGEVSVNSFQIGQNSVTWGEWKHVRDWAADNGYDIGAVGNGCADHHPVHSVNWYDVLKWCNAKSEMHGLTPVYTDWSGAYKTGEFVPEINAWANGYRLPSEAEWEFAARGGNQTNGFVFSGSDNIEEVGWHVGNSHEAACSMNQGRGTWSVGRKAANELGLYDMSGNVFDWCWEVAGTSNRRLRGGSWLSQPTTCTVAFRSQTGPTTRANFIGVRLTRNSAE